MATSSGQNDASYHEEPQVFELVTAELTSCMKECIKKFIKQEEIQNTIKQYGVNVVTESGILKSFTGSLHSVWSLEKYLFQVLKDYCNSDKVNIEGTQESSVDDAKTIPTGDQKSALSPVSSVSESQKAAISSNAVARKDSKCEDSSPSSYADHIDIDEHVWHYILYKHSNLIGEFSSKFDSSVRAVSGCNCEDKSSADVCKLVITSHDEKQLHEACEEIAQIYRLILEGDIISSPVDYPPRSQLNFLQSELDSRAILLYQSSPCYLIGPRMQMQQAKAALQSALCDFKQGPEAAKIQQFNEDDLLNFEIPSGIVVHVRKGNIIHQKTDAIVDAANVRLMAGSGVARAIADAAGKQMENDCHKWVKEHGHMKTSIPMHTTAGNLAKPIRYIIHVAGPDSSHYKDKQECYALLRKTFKNCLSYANDVLTLKSITVPAISSGVYGVPKDIVARLAYEGLMDFVCELQRQPDDHQHLMDIHFVNIDAETTEVMERVFRHLSEAKHRFDKLSNVNSAGGKAADVPAGQQKISKRPETLDKKGDLKPPANTKSVTLDSSSAPTSLEQPLTNVNISVIVKPETTESPKDLTSGVKCKCVITNQSVPDREEVPAESVGHQETNSVLHPPVKADSSDTEPTAVSQFEQKNQINPDGESIQETQDLEPNDNLVSTVPRDTDTEPFEMVESENDDKEDKAGNAGADSKKNSLDGSAQSEKSSSKLKDDGSQVGNAAAAAAAKAINDITLPEQPDSSDVSSSTPNAPSRAKSSRALRKCKSCTD